jgi:hypothetical protein
MEKTCEVCLKEEEHKQFVSTVKILNLEKKKWRICDMCYRHLTGRKYIIHYLESELPSGEFDKNYQEFKCVKPFEYYEKVKNTVKPIQ